MPFEKRVPERTGAHRAQSGILCNKDFICGLTAGSVRRYIRKSIQPTSQNA